MATNLNQFHVADAPPGGLEYGSLKELKRKLDAYIKQKGIPDGRWRTKAEKQLEAERRDASPTLPKVRVKLFDLWGGL